MKWIPLALLLLAPQEGPTLNAAWGTVRTVDPALAITPQDVRVVEALFDGLAGATSKVEGPVVRFTLPDRAWTDGRPVTASDYRFAWIRCLDPDTGSPWAFRFRLIKNARAWHEGEALAGRLLQYESEGPAGRVEIARAVNASGTKRHLAAVQAAMRIEKNEEQQAALLVTTVLLKEREDVDVSAVGIKAVDAKTLQVTLDKPHPGFPQLAATSPFRPVPEHVVTKRRDQWTHPGHIATCGAFNLEKWTRQGLVLGREGTGPGVKRVSLLSSDLAGEVWPLYERGSVEWVDRSFVPPEKVEALAASGEIRAVAGPGVVFLRLKPELKAALRRAMAMSADRALLAKKSRPRVRGDAVAGGRRRGARPGSGGGDHRAGGGIPGPQVPRMRLLVWKDPGGGDGGRCATRSSESLAVSIRIDLREGSPYQAAISRRGLRPGASRRSLPRRGPRGRADLFLKAGRRRRRLLESALAVPLIREGEVVRGVAAGAKPSPALLSPPSR
jgi:hypothetical protein